MSPAARRWLILAPIVLALAAVVARQGLRPRAITVEAAAAAIGRVEQTATNSRAGTVEARRRARLSPDTGGRVLALPCRRGAVVAAGAILLELDAALERGEVELRSRQLESARADGERACLAGQLAARELERQRRLAAEALVPADALDRFESAAREAEAGCSAAQATRASAAAALELARRTLEKRTLRAPFGGVIADLSTEVGEWITPAPPGVPIPPVIDLLDPDSIYLSLPMDEVDAGRLRPGLAARATVDSRPGEHFAGRLVRVAPYVLDVEAQNRTVEIEVELEPPVAGLLPGTSADIEIVLEARDGVLRVPTGAVMTQDRVLLVEGGKLRERAVETGLRNWDFVEIRSGLAAGDRVVTSLDRPGVEAGARVVVDDGARPARP